MDSSFLEKWVAELKQLKEQCVNVTQLEQLREENSHLKLEVEKWKNKLVQLENACGVQQVPLPKDTPEPGPSGAAGVDPTFESLFPKYKIFKQVLASAGESSPANQQEPASETKQQQQPPTEKKKKEKTPQAAAPKKLKGGAEGEEPPVDVGRLDLRVGRIVSVKKHPDADSLYVEEVDVGEEKPRTVVSGLVKHVPLEEMQDRMVVLLCNLKPAKMRGVTSEAMVMCASTPDKVEILVPPAGSVPGDQVHVEGYPRIPDPVLNPKKKIFETVAPDLKTSNDKVATYKGSAFTVPDKGMVTAPSLVGVNIK